MTAAGANKEKMAPPPFTKQETFWVLQFSNR